MEVRKMAWGDEPVSYRRDYKHCGPDPGQRARIIQQHKIRRWKKAYEVNPDSEWGRKYRAYRISEIAPWVLMGVMVLIILVATNV